MTDASRWQIRVDTGGTFTDCRAIAPDDAEPRLAKVLSSGILCVAVREWISDKCCRIVVPKTWQIPEDFFVGFAHSGHRVAAWDRRDGTLTFQDSFPSQTLATLDLATGEEAPIIGIRVLTGTALRSSFPALDLRLATTRGTNALLEKKGADVAFFITEGFGDLLHIRDQRRPDLFALEHHLPLPIPESFHEVHERLDQSGRVIAPLDLGSVEAAAQSALDRGCDTAAVALLHSYRNPAHEIALRDYLRSLGFKHVSLSSELAPLIKILPRAETAAIDATLTPVMRSFIEQVSSALGSEAQLLVMSSAGGLESADRFHPKDSLFSGPAGGVVGAATAGRMAGFEKIITFDMGGTSTDVARYDGDFVYRFEQRIGDARLLSPALKIATVAAGGGSICTRDETGLHVGPKSAGADPGPACYGRGGPLTITDVNLLLGRFDPDSFGIPIGEENVAAAQRAAIELQGDPTRDSVDADFLLGLLEIAIEQMADSIREISLREGADPSDYALLAFGGAGPLHACAIAEKLSIDTVIVPNEAGVLSAFGLHHAVVERFSERQPMVPLAEVGGDLPAWLEEMAEDARSKFSKNQQSEVQVRRRIAELRFSGQDAALSIEVGGTGELANDFRERYAQVFGYQPAASTPIELVALRVAVSTPSPEVGDGQRKLDRKVDGHPLSVDQQIPGPARVQDPHSTCWIAEGWIAEAQHDGGLILKFEEHTAAQKRGDQRRQPEAVRHELFRHRFGAMVEEMGAMLERSAISTNVKERLDFSCALLDAEGNLVVNAPHIPVHLGALGECVRRVAAQHRFRPGDMVVTNHPGFGGSHLPDVTVISAVFDGGDRPFGYVANRAHHAEIGGISPGSMPPAATSLVEEGVVIAPTLLFDQDESCFDAVAALLREADYPTRNLRDNLADLRAQAAANHRGISALGHLIEQHGSATISAEFVHLADTAAKAIGKRLAAWEFTEADAESSLDDGSVIRIQATKVHDRLQLDFSGTSDRHPGNLNATPAIVRSALLYVLRLWTGGSENLPLNEGLMRNIDVSLPPCFLNPDFPENANACPAVVGGNVETSQKIVDALVKLFGLQAASQGTMNNFLFGSDEFGYYETIGGGAGAGPGYDGASGLHCHMTNTGITDPEILESRYPVRLRQFSLRRNSGGTGRHRGGDGLIREIEFLAPLDVSLLTQNRTQGAAGMAGGGSGAPGRQILTQPECEPERLSSIAAIRAQAGSVLRIETPGGGAWGKP